MTFASLGETEAVGADYDSVLQENIVADAAVFADYGVCVRKEIVADLYAAINDDVREQHAVLADLDVLADDHRRAEVSRAAAAYLGLATKVRSQRRARAMPLRPVISVSADLLSRRALRAEAICE